MNIVTLIFAIITMAAAVAVVYLVKTAAEEYRAENEHERTIEQKRLEQQNELLETDTDYIDKELEQEKNE